MPVSTTSVRHFRPGSAANTPGGPDPFGGYWPGPWNTGYPAGTSLTQVPGSVTSGEGWAWSESWPGLLVTGTPAVLDSLQVTGDVIIQAGNGTWDQSTPAVTISRCLTTDHRMRRPE